MRENRKTCRMHQVRDMNRGAGEDVYGVIGNIGPTEASVYYFVSILDGKVPKACEFDRYDWRSFLHPFHL